MLQPSRYCTLVLVSKTQYIFTFLNVQIIWVSTLKIKKRTKFLGWMRLHGCIIYMGRFNLKPICTIALEKNILDEVGCISLYF